MVSATPQKTLLRFFRSRSGKEPVREWLKRLDNLDRHAVGLDLMRAQWHWPVGMPLVAQWARGCGKYALTCRATG
jgi:hypothetical protein